MLSPRTVPSPLPSPPTAPSPPISARGTHHMCRLSRAPTFTWFHSRALRVPPSPHGSSFPNPCGGAPPRSHKGGEPGCGGAESQARRGVRCAAAGFGSHCASSHPLPAPHRSCRRSPALRRIQPPPRFPATAAVDAGTRGRGEDEARRRSHPCTAPPRVTGGGGGPPREIWRRGEEEEESILAVISGVWRKWAAEARRRRRRCRAPVPSPLPSLQSSSRSRRRSFMPELEAAAAGGEQRRSASSRRPSSAPPQASFAPRELAGAAHGSRLTTTAWPSRGAAGSTAAADREETGPHRRWRPPQGRGWAHRRPSVVWERERDRERRWRGWGGGRSAP
ncbi:unnamed protein product [Urochloa humidicola]